MNASKKNQPTAKKLATKRKDSASREVGVKATQKKPAGIAPRPNLEKSASKQKAIPKKPSDIKGKARGAISNAKSTNAARVSKVVASPAKSTKKPAAKVPPNKEGRIPLKRESAPKTVEKPVKSASSAKPAMKPIATKPAAANKTVPSKGNQVDSKLKKAADTAKSKSTMVNKTIAETKNQAQKPPTPINGKAAATPPAKSIPVAKPHEPVPPPSNTNPEIVAKIRSAQAEKELRKDLAQPPPKTSLTPLNAIPPMVKGKDRLILMVRDPYWIHAHWDIMRHSVDRAKAALAENWHTVKPILRLLKLDDSGTTNNSEVISKDIDIHGGVRNWYVDVDSPPSRYKMLMGYLCANGRFYELARSNIVTTPAPGGKEATDDHWADVATDAEHIYSMSGGYGDDTQTGDLTEVFEERLKRTMDADVLSQFGSGAEGSLKRHKQFHFDVNAELVVFGSTHPEAHVSVGAEPVKVRTDGSFSIRLPFPDRRQVLPATAKSRDGVDEQTVVIAVERNTKVMEPLSSDTDDL